MSRQRKPCGQKLRIRHLCVCVYVLLSILRQRWYVCVGLSTGNRMPDIRGTCSSTGRSLQRLVLRSLFLFRRVGNQICFATSGNGCRQVSPQNKKLYLPVQELYLIALSCLCPFFALRGLCRTKWGSHLAQEMLWCLSSELLL